MSNNSWQDLKEACNKIVGHWRSEDTDEEFIFHFNDKMLQMAKLTVITPKKTFDTEYGLGMDISRGIELDKTNIYFDIGSYEKRYYSILSLTKDMLVIEEFNMDLNGTRGTPRILKRVNPPDVADDILQGLSSNDPQP